MNLDDLKQKLSELFEAQASQQKGTQEKLLRVIENLTEKKEKIKEEMLALGEEDQTTEAYDDLEHEYRVVSKLLKNARKHYNEEVTNDDTTG